ncbi:very-short-patch-repair endonuclease [Rhodococcus sp. 27YEA15]|uniref:DUF559 domain-containing protein n=1 Tax=Rhodococcus sp. 27YEA15 TaxID=3156259 RepID=UPI003C7AEC33
MAIHTRTQLLAQGMSGSSISRAVRSGRLIRILPSIYSTTEPDYFDLCSALVLWKPDAILSHSTGAWLWGLLPQPQSIVEATVPRTAQIRGPDWVVLHRRETPATSHLSHGLPVVPIEQCFVDAATMLTRPELEALFDSAISTRVDWKAIARHCESVKGMHGIPAVREQLRLCCPQTLSEAERVVARELSARNFPLEINGHVGRYYGDLICRRGRVIVEIDGREFHIDPDVFDHDRRRRNALIDADWRILRYSAATATAHLDMVVDDIIRVVRKRRRSRRA